MKFSKAIEGYKLSCLTEGYSPYTLATIKRMELRIRPGYLIAVSDQTYAQSNLNVLHITTTRESMNLEKVLIKHHYLCFKHLPVID